MSVQFYKTGVVQAIPISADIAFSLVDENDVELADENANILTDGLGLDTDGLHGFIEGFNFMSIYSSSTITCNELIE
jgi:hypothetical protein